MSPSDQRTATPNPTALPMTWVAAESGSKNSGLRLVAAGSRPEKDSSVDLPDTRYARTVDGLSIAYQVLGRGPVDLVFTQGWISNVDACWGVPPLGTFFRQLASISRLVIFDRRGSGSRTDPPRWNRWRSSMVWTTSGR